MVAWWFNNYNFLIILFICHNKINNHITNKIQNTILLFIAKKFKREVLNFPICC